MLDALIEVDFTGERAGVAPEDVAGFSDRVGALEGLRLRGLMTIPPAGRHRPTTRGRGSDDSVRCVIGSGRTIPTWWT